MSREQTPLPDGGNRLLSGRSRTRSYGSLFQSDLSSYRLIEHKIQHGETLQGLALRYGVSMELIKRANRLYTNDSIFLKKYLFIPVLSDVDFCSDRETLGEDVPKVDVSSQNENKSEDRFDDSKERVSDLSPDAFLKRLDGLISQSKQVAVRGYKEAEERVAALEAACTTSTSDCWRLTKSQSAISSSILQQQQKVPLSTTKLTHRLRDREDEIFEL
ncbi:lysM and putative peptidoglycan-binding domain-containing protein 1 [Thalassophryne amazonica]|uniref:lysM and putative peptidoglycan-binding domain-containing protein 1 n=1 Tax=Thalassophryne amazonica TaxID=390379 RepID=UPI0014722B24|nr:lysM and putative peptidoglycan-binding domain-containing protein 1 [Thalassophryne amazonica]